MKHLSTSVAPMMPAKDSALSSRTLSNQNEATLLASIVVTTYRREAMLAELLDVLCPQFAGRAIEVIIVDNCPAQSAREIVEARLDGFLRYEPESCIGVVHARNRGVAAARAPYVIFLDDDEIPGPGWLDAWLAQADDRTDASFGRIVPRLLAPCPDGLLGQVERNFGRNLRTTTDADVSAWWPYLGTGNAMFHKHRCFGETAPFDARFNARGGEDVWLIRSLVKQKRSLVWNHSAVVEELVPAERMTRAFLELRRFNQGQLRCILAFGKGGVAGVARVAAWMLVGTVQFTGNHAAAAVASALGLPHVADFRCRASGGLGKMIWWHRPRVQAYGES